jgi:hypothetical protein
MTQNPAEKQQAKPKKDKENTSKPVLNDEAAFEKLVKAAEANIKQSEKNLGDIENQVVEELNKKHAGICLDQFYILTEKENPIFGGKDFSLESKQSFKNHYENKIPDGHKKTKAEIWLKSPDRREYKGIVFDPTKDGNVGNYYNLWTGYSRKPQVGNCSLYWTHVKENICSNDPEAYRFVRKWLAYIFQRPDEVHTALVLVGSQGVGKNSLVEPLGVLLGNHYVLLSNVSELVSNFNYHLKHAVLIHANEALWGGNRKELGSLKAMITEKTCLIEGKGKDRIMVRNFKHVILSSNEDWPVHLDADDRRFFVLRVSEAHKEDHPYFEAIQTQLNAGGYEALLYDLLNEDLSNFNPRRFPNSNDAFEIKLRSAKTMHQYMYTVLNDGCFDVGNATPHGNWSNIPVSTETVFQDYCTWCVRNGKKERAEKDMLLREIKKLIPSIADTRPTEEGKRIRKIVLPSLEQARKDFEKAYKATDSIWYA